MGGSYESEGAETVAERARGREKAAAEEQLSSSVSIPEKAEGEKTTAAPQVKTKTSAVR